ncbi:MAG: hypothetical protein KGL53_01500, partial [Elusimicrobia bacterium]|nr:hypothetical protein [Elusimicrobiota bacterium]
MRPAAPLRAEALALLLLAASPAASRAEDPHAAQSRESAVAEAVTSLRAAVSRVHETAQALPDSPNAPAPKPEAVAAAAKAARAFATELRKDMPVLREHVKPAHHEAELQTLLDAAAEAAPYAQLPPPELLRRMKKVETDFGRLFPAPAASAAPARRGGPNHKAVNHTLHHVSATGGLMWDGGAGGTGDAVVPVGGQMGRTSTGRRARSSSSSDERVAADGRVQGATPGSTASGERRSAGVRSGAVVKGSTGISSSRGPANRGQVQARGLHVNAVPTPTVKPKPAAAAHPAAPVSPEVSNCEKLLNGQGHTTTAGWCKTTVTGALFSGAAVQTLHDMFHFGGDWLSIVNACLMLASVILPFLTGIGAIAGVVKILLSLLKWTMIASAAALAYQATKAFAKAFMYDKNDPRYVQAMYAGGRALAGLVFMALAVLIGWQVGKSMNSGMLGEGVAAIRAKLGGGAAEVPLTMRAEAVPTPEPVSKPVVSENVQGRTMRVAEAGEEGLGGRSEPVERA